MATRALEDGAPVREVALSTRHARVQTFLDHCFDRVVDAARTVAARIVAHMRRDAPNQLTWRTSYRVAPSDLSVFFGETSA